MEITDVYDSAGLLHLGVHRLDPLSERFVTESRGKPFPVVMMIRDVRPGEELEPVGVDESVRRKDAALEDQLDFGHDGL